MPIRSGAMQRPRGCTCGNTLRHRYDEVGLPCSSTMGSPSPTSTYAISLPRTRRRHFCWRHSLVGFSRLISVLMPGAWAHFAPTSYIRCLCLSIRDLCIDEVDRISARELGRTDFRSTEPAPTFEMEAFHSLRLRLPMTFTHRTRGSDGRTRFRTSGFLALRKDAPGQRVASIQKIALGRTATTGGTGARQIAPFTARIRGRLSSPAPEVTTSSRGRLHQGFLVGAVCCTD